MYYCFLYGGPLDGKFFRASAPQKFYPQTNFFRPGHPEDVQAISHAKRYTLSLRLPGPLSSMPEWCIYIGAEDVMPSAMELIRAVLPAVLLTPATVARA